MSVPLHIHYRGLPQSESIRGFITAQIESLLQTYPGQQMLSFHVTLELLNHRAGKAACYQAMVEMQVPGRRLLAGRNPGRRHEHGDAYAALAAAFQAIERQLQTYMQRRRQEVKHHESTTNQGEVVRLFPGEGYGFVATPEGREVYFDENAVLGDGFSRLEVGSLVRFAEEDGEEGPQASSLRFLGDPRLRAAPAH